MHNIPCVVLAGGAGSRLRPLTDVRAKPAVPFGKHRIIDFAIAAAVNGGAKHIYVVTQYAPDSLIRHVNGFWGPYLGFGRSITTAQPRHRNDAEAGFSGTACAMYQNWHLIERIRAQVSEVAILSGDHIMVMNMEQMVAWHYEHNSAFTVAAVTMRREDAAGNFGIFEIDKRYRVQRFVEKPSLDAVPGIPGNPEYCLASMGNYIANAPTLATALTHDAHDKSSTHDFGSDVIPRLIASGARVHAYPFEQDRTPGQPTPYWRDVGTLTSFYHTLNQMLGHEPPVNMQNPDYPIPSCPDNLPTAQTLGDNVRTPFSQFAGGARIDNAYLRWCSIGRRSWVGNHATLDSSHIGDDVYVGSGTQLLRVICDKHVRIPDNIKVGFDRDHDNARGFTTVDLNERGEWLTVIPRGYTFA